MSSEPQKCSTCGKPKRDLKNASFTQWIFDRDSCACERIKLAVPKEPEESLPYCPKCNKPILSSGEGSMTQWIFRGNACDCNRPKKAFSITAIERKVEEDELAKLPELEMDPDNFPRERYKAVEELGKGGSGTVYLCVDKLLHKKVAVKTLHWHTPDQLIHFQTEARATSRLNHSAVLTLLDFGPTKSGAPYMVLEYFDGVTLERYLDDHVTLPPDVVIHMAETIASALSAAHNLGIFHRDLKPSNILLDKKSIALYGRGGNNNYADPRTLQFKLIDFGVAKIREGVITLSEIAGNLQGTPAYMAPEIVRGGEYDERSEIYALGCLLFECLTGTPPFLGENDLETANLHISQPPPTLAEVTERPFDPQVETLIAKCLRKQPEERYKSMEDLADAIRERRVERVSHSREEEPQKLSARKITYFALAVVSAAVVVGTISNSFTRRATSPTDSKPKPKHSAENKNVDKAKEAVKETAMDNLMLSSMTPTEVAKQQGDPEKQLELADSYYNGKGVKKDPYKAFEIYLKLGKDGHAAAQEALGYMLENGIGTGRDYVQAKIWYRKSALQGNTTAQINLGLLYLCGFGGKPNYSESMKWFQSAWKGGNIRALIRMGDQYARGLSVKKDLKQAKKLFELAAQNGDPLGNVYLGDLYASGLLGKKDIKKAFRQYEIAADMGSMYGHQAVGYAYLYGWGVPSNYDEAWRHLQIGAGSGDAKCKSAIAYMRLKGLGAEKDEQEAFRLMYEAANLNDAPAQQMLGYFYEHGIGVNRNRVEAQRWYKISEQARYVFRGFAPDNAGHPL